MIIPKIIVMILCVIVMIIDIVLISKKKVKRMISSVSSIIVCIVLICTNAYQLANPDYDFQRNSKDVILFVKNQFSAQTSQYHDRKGNPVKYSSDMVYYDRKDNIYHIEHDENEDICLISETSDKQFDYNRCYIDGAGYFYYDEKNIMKYNEESGYFYDGTGVVYYSLAEANWDRYGNLLNNNPG